MKRCEYCGTQYDDKVVICPADAHPTIDPQAQTSADSSAAGGQIAFTAKIVSPLSAAGAYRIFIQSGELVFIQVNSEASSMLDALVPLLGPAGGLITLFRWLFSRRDAKEFQDRLQTDDPEILLHTSEKIFRLHLAEIRRAEIEPATFWSFGGKDTGRFTLSVRHGESLKLAFASGEDMDVARQLFAPAMVPERRPALDGKLEPSGITIPSCKITVPQKH